MTLKTTQKRMCILRRPDPPKLEVEYVGQRPSPYI